MPYICLHKSEWNRLKTKANPAQESFKDETKYYKKLIEKSQKWIKSWPDTIEGRMELIQKQQKEDQRQKAAIAAIRKQQQQRDSRQAQAIAKARQLIFEGSSYGQQLLSALLASKVIEEREAQIALKKEIEAKELELEKKRYTAETYFCKADHEKQKQERRNKNILFARDNKCMYEELNANLKKENSKEVHWAREDAQLMQELLDWEKEEERKEKKCQELQRIKFLKEQQDLREAKLKREIENDAKIEKEKKEYEHKQMKIRQTQKQININKSRADAIERNFKILEEIEKEKRKHFEEFLDKREKLDEEEATKKEQEGIIKQQHKHEAKKLLSKQYKTAMEASLSRNNKNIRNSTCDRQCLLAKSHMERCGKGQKKLIRYQGKTNPVFKNLEFLSPREKLTEKLAQREKIPSPWTGTRGAHAQFADVAGRVLAECKHKTMAKKVVDEYRRLNRLDATTLPVENY